jgi:hypothetical protein
LGEIVARLGKGVETVAMQKSERVAPLLQVTKTG